MSLSMPMLPLPSFMPGAGPRSLKSSAAYPVWSGSTTKEVRFQPLPKKAAVRLWHRARAFDRQTHVADKHGGALGHMALKVLHTLIFDFLNFSSGRLDPSHAAIARAAGVGERTVRNALNRLRDLGLLHWQRRSEQDAHNGGFVLVQVTNAYAVLPDSQWRGYRPPQEPPAPMPGTWGDHPPLPSPLAQVAIERKEGADMQRVVQILESDPGDGLAAALASLGRRVFGRDSA